MSLGERRPLRFPSVLLHPPPRAFIASYGEMSRRSGVAAEEDNHSDISPLRISHLRPQIDPDGRDCDKSSNLNPLSGFRNPRRCLRTLHRPADVGDCNITSKKPDLHIVDFQRAVTETFARGGSSTPYGNLQEDAMRDQTDLIRGTLDLPTTTIALEPRLSAGVDLVLQRT